MKLLAGALVLLAAAIAFVGAVALFDDARDESRPPPTAPTTTATISRVARDLAAREGVDPLVMQERLRIAETTCDLLKDVGASEVASVCRFNIVGGEAWWEDMPPRQLREVAEALIRAQR